MGVIHTWNCAPLFLFSWQIWEDLTGMLVLFMVKEVRHLLVEEIGN
jgi:hypothetical protein